MSVRVRFAPSPTGLLHLGNVRTALFNWLFAKQGSGDFILRIEDTDAKRTDKRFEVQLEKDLRWLGLTWDEGVDVGGGYGPYRQTERFGIYRNIVLDLLESGQAYYCFCPQKKLEKIRREQTSKRQSSLYPGTCRDLHPTNSAKRVASGERAVVRFKVRKGEISFADLVFGKLTVNCREIGDFVLLRSDGSVQYNFAAVVDDVQMKISHVIRGEGHISNTYRQILVYEALRVQPPFFAHLSTIRAPDGSKLSKRHGSISVQEFRRQGYLPEALLNYLALLGWSPEEDGAEFLNSSELINRFSLNRVNKTPAVFDKDKLNWLNRQYLRRLTPGELAELVVPYLVSLKRITLPISPAVQHWLEALVKDFQKYLEKASDIVDLTAVIFDFCPERDLTIEETDSFSIEETSYKVLLELQRQTSGMELLTVKAMEWVLSSIKKTVGVRGKDLFHPVRMALTGKSSGPDLKLLVPLIESGSRLNLKPPIPGVAERVSRMLAHLA